MCWTIKSIATVNKQKHVYMYVLIIVDEVIASKTTAVPENTVEFGKFKVSFVVLSFLIKIPFPMNFLTVNLKTDIGLISQGLRTLYHITHSSLVYSRVPFRTVLFKVVKRESDLPADCT